MLLYEFTYTPEKQLSNQEILHRILPILQEESRQQEWPTSYEVLYYPTKEEGILRYQFKVEGEQ